MITVVLGDRTNVERDVCEMVLAHFPKGVEAAYRRTTALDKRRTALTLWGDFVTGANAGNNVVSIIGGPNP